MTRKTLTLVFGVALIGACSDGDKAKQDAGDAKAPDVAGSETKVTDVPMQTDLPVADTKVPDAAVPDVAITDTKVTDTSIIDTAVVDVQVTEAGVTEAGVSEAGSGPKQMVYVGCKGGTGSPADLQIFVMNPATGDLTTAGNYNPGSSLSFPAVHPTHKYLYVTKSVEDKVISLAINQATGQLSDNGASEVIPSSSGGIDAGVPSAADGGAIDAGAPAASNPVYALVDPTGSYLVATTYAGNNVSIFKLGADGKIGALVDRDSAGIHAHSALLDPQGKYLFVPYHGSDIIAQYYFNATTGAITPNTVPTVAVGTPGTPEGPRHMDFHPNGRYAYLITEFAAHVKTFTFDSVSGRLTEIQSLPTTKTTISGQVGADIHVAKVGATAGKFLYVSNREEQTLVAYSINQSDGKLTEIDHVDLTPNKKPRNFNIDESGKFLLEANQDSANIATYAIDQTTGKLGKLKEYTVCTSPYFVLNVSVPKTAP
jgi:6-phosphogluconolactonase